MLKAKEKVKSFFISRPRHEIITLQLLIIAILLLACSFIPFGFNSGTGILQGISTGIISGIVLLFVTEAKSRNFADISENYSKAVSILKILDAMDSIYADLYHQTYHGKKYEMGSSDYSKLMIRHLDKLHTFYCDLPTHSPRLANFDTSEEELDFYLKSMEEFDRLCTEISEFTNSATYSSLSEPEKIAKLDEFREQFGSILLNLHCIYAPKAAELRDSLMAIHKSIV